MLYTSAEKKQHLDDTLAPVLRESIKMDIVKAEIKWWGREREIWEQNTAAKPFDCSI